MPTNLPPVYYDIEKRFRSAESVDEKIELLQEMYSVVPKHKGTDHLRADLRRKLAKLKGEALEQKSVAKRDSAYHIAKAGAGQVVIVGPINSGKSALMEALTGVEAGSSAVPHNTWEPAPAMMPLDNIQVQLVDTPSLSREYVEPRLRELIRHADVVLLVVDLLDDPIQQLKDSITLLDEFRIAPAHRQSEYPADRSMKFIPFLVLVNKCDADEDEELYHIYCEQMDQEWHCLPISALTGRYLDILKQRVYEYLNILRVYTKAPGKDPDLNTPFVLKKGATVEELAGKIHKDFTEKLKFARVWGDAVHPGQMVQRDYLLQEGDVVELHV